MRHFHRIPSLAILSTAVVFFAVGCGDDHAEHAGHDEHAEHAADGLDAGHDDDEGHDVGHDEHAGHDDDEAPHDEQADGDAGHDEHAGEEGAQHVELTPEQRRRIGLTVATAAAGSIERELSFPGEVVLNPDRVAHVVPRAAGIVREVQKSMGDTVQADEVLAWIESAELAEAKMDFFAAEADVGRSRVELPRAKAIFGNVNRLLAVLESEPDDEALAALDGLEMGDYRGRLLTAHADFVAARHALERERVLREKSISSEQDLTSAQAEFRRARAELRGSLDTARFEVQVAFGEAARAQQVADFGAVAAEQSLRLKGVDEATIRTLRELAPRTGELRPCACSETSCEHNSFPSLRERLGTGERLGWYALRAPFAGVVIEKHLTLGEKVGDGESVFAVADTSTVWTNLSVFQKDLASIAPGQPVVVDVTGGTATHTGSIAYVAPIVDADTRTTIARVILPNEDGALRPGLFVSVRVALPTVEAPVVVPRGAVQILDQKTVVFIAEGDGFEAVPVVLGRGDRTRVEITHGLEPGQSYVEQGAFELKAKVATSGLGAHAGHGH